MGDEVGADAPGSKEPEDGFFEDFGSSAEFGRDCLEGQFPFGADKEFVGWQFGAGKEDSKVEISSESF